MSFNLQEVLANLAEKEKIKGHHSPEGRAIRTLGRAASGWSAGGLSGRDVMALCDQAIEDWLKARLGFSSWSQPGLTALLARAVNVGLITRSERERLQRFRNFRERFDQNGQIPAQRLGAGLLFCIRLIEKYW